MAGACTGHEVHGTTDLHTATSRPSQGTHRHAGCEQEAHYSSCRLCVPFLRVCWSLKVSTWTCIFDALDEGLHAAAAPEFAALVPVINRLPPRGIGTGVRSQEVVALPIWKLNTLHMCLQLAEEDTIKHGSFFLMRGGIVAALRRNIKFGLGLAWLCPD